MAQSAASGRLDAALEGALDVRQRHNDTASELLESERFHQLRLRGETYFDALELLLRGIAAVGELTARTTDGVLSFGELLSSQVVTAAFVARGLRAVLADARQCIVSDAVHTHASPLLDETRERLLSHVKPLLNRGRLADFPVLTRSVPHLDYFQIADHTLSTPLS